MVRAYRHYEYTQLKVHECLYERLSALMLECLILENALACVLHPVTQSRLFALPVVLGVFAVVSCLPLSFLSQSPSLSLSLCLSVSLSLSLRRPPLQGLASNILQFHNGFAG